MTDSYALCGIIEPLVEQYQPQSILTAGEMAAACFQSANNTRLQHVTTPFSLQQLIEISAVDLAVVSHLTESMNKSVGQQWLGLIKNLYTSHVLLISYPKYAEAQGWHFTDYLAMGFKHLAGTKEGIQVFSYAIESYQPKREWLNSRFWAHPDLYDKYRW